MTVTVTPAPAAAADTAAPAVVGPVLLDVPAKDIAPHTGNPRHQVGDVDDLAASIAEHGILEPLIVAPWPVDSKATATQKRKHRLIAGHRRLAAAVKAGLATVPVIYRSDLATEAAQLEAMLVENLHRADLTPVEEAEAYQALLEFPGFTQSKLAKDVGQPVSRIRDRLKLVKLPDPVRGKLHDGQITITDALAVGEFADDPKVTKDLTKVAGTSSFDWALQQARNNKRLAEAAAARVKVLEAAGVHVRKTAPEGGKRIDSYDGLDLMPQGVRVDETKRDEWVIKNHATCPGAVSVYTTEYGRPTVQHWCTTPKEHPKPKVKKSAAEIKAAKAEAERKAKVEADVATATPLRRRHLHDTLATVTDDVARRRLTAAITAQVFDYSQDPLADFAAMLDVLDVPHPTPAEGKRKVTADQVRDALRPALDKLTLPALVVVLDVDQHARGEKALTSTKEWVYGGDREDAAAWLDVLWQEYAYEPSDFERSRRPADANAEDSEDNDDDGYGYATDEDA